jgi:hypothetical protein
MLKLLRNRSYFYNSKLNKKKSSRALNEACFKNYSQESEILGIYNIEENTVKTILF